MKGISARSVLLMAEFGAQSLANTAWAFATLRVLDHPLFDAIASQASCIIDDFAPQALANTAWAYGTLSISNELLAESIAMCSLQHIADFKPQELAATGWSVAELEFLHEPLMRAIAAASKRHMKNGTLTNPIAGMMLVGLARSKDPQLALEFYEDLEASGINPGALGLGALLSKLENNANFLHEEVHLLSSTRWGPGDLRPIATATASARLAEAGEAEAALELLQHSVRGGLSHQVLRACGGGSGSGSGSGAGAEGILVGGGGVGGVGGGPSSSLAGAGSEGGDD
eukprot:TRINITY_DN1729_c0_g1_i5.p1 TRINITY_DN1729_c0_g1~~TRINITY_DN1729_c0_g1_i5.p1  ORF type:complete len:286 (-),score=69.98 TRINITY_DN1729_c0_g1_i5:70-927(-)